jgi:molybdopterin molybdotransferase
MAHSPGAAVVSFEDARHIVEQQAATVRGTHTEIADLLQVGGRVLAVPITADRDFPPFDRAARDGFAVRAADVAQFPASLKLIGEIRAGAPPEDIPRKVGPGEAVGIMTGAPTPEGADAVVMVEYTSRRGEQVEIARAVHAGENIVPTGSEGRRGDVLLNPGARIGEAAIAILASVGKAKVEVYAKPRVAVLSTGDEVVAIETTPGPTQIRNSNSYSLAAQVQAAGGEPVLLPIAPDEPKRLRELMEEGFKSDLLLLAGGVSMGKYDLVEQVLSELKAEFFFTGAQIQPGKPIVFGRVNHAPVPTQKRPRHDVPMISSPKYFFGLPGNPVSTMVTFELFARPMIEALSGMSPRKLVFVCGRLKTEIKVKTGLKRFLPGILSGEFEQAEVELVPWGGSGDIAATARSNCYVVVPPDRERIPAGEFVPVLLR